MDQQLQIWLTAGHHFDDGDRSIFYRDEGRGPVLLCIHGFPSASWDWHRVWPLLVGGYRLIAADMLGFGFSDKPRDIEYSIADQATLHERLLSSLGIDEVHVLAHDYGDTVTQELIARYQARLRNGEAGLRLRTVCLLNGGLFPETHRARPIQKLLHSPLGPLLVRLYNERAFRRSFKPIFGTDTQPDDAELARWWALIAYNDGHTMLHRLLHYITERKRHRARWVGSLIGASIPLRLIAGLDDPVSGAHMVQRYRELIPRANIVTLPGIGHYPQWEAAEKVADAVAAFAH